MLTHEDGLKATGLLYRWLDLVYKEDGPAVKDREGWDLVAETKQYVKWAAGGRDYTYPSLKSNTTQPSSKSE